MDIDQSTGDVYFGGSFANVNGVPRPGAACVNKNGKLSTWNPVPNGTVRGIKFTGAGIYIVGEFSTLVGSSRNGAGLVDASGTLQSWNPLLGSGSKVYCIDIDANGIIFLGGEHSGSFGTGNRLLAINASGVVQTFDAGFSGGPFLYVRCVRCYGSGTSTMVYAGGRFLSTFLATGGSGTRNGIVQLNGLNGLASDAKATTWDAQLTVSANDPSVDSMDTDSSDNVFFSGSFITVRTLARTGFGAMTSAGSALSWGVGLPAAASTLTQQSAIKVDRANSIVYWSSGLSWTGSIDEQGALSTGNVDWAWNPRIWTTAVRATGVYCFALYTAERAIWTGGDFNRVLDQSDQRVCLAKWKDYLETLPTVLAF